MGSSNAFKNIEPVELVEGVFNLHFNLVRSVQRDVEQAALSKIVLDEREHILDRHVVRRIRAVEHQRYAQLLCALSHDQAAVDGELVEKECDVIRPPLSSEVVQESQELFDVHRLWVDAVNLHASLPGNRCNHRFGFSVEHLIVHLQWLVLRRPRCEGESLAGEHHFISIDDVKTSVQ